MTKVRGLLIVGLLLCASPSFAGVISLDGVSWETLGIVSVETGSKTLPPNPPSVTVGPTGSNADWVLLDSGDPTLPPGVAGASVGALENFFNMTPGFLSNPPNPLLGRNFGNYVSGSGIKQSITMAAGAILSFDWHFVTAEDPLFGFKDAAMFVLNGDGVVLKSAPLPATNPLSFQVLDDQVFMAPTAGTYLIGVGVFNATQDVFPSYLGLDDFKVNGVALEGLATSVPEPGTLLMLTTGLGTVLLSRRRFGIPKERA